MRDMITQLQLYLSYPFVRYVLIVGTLIALCSSMLGVILVLKRFSFIGDGLSHVAFGAMAVASALKLADQTTFIMPVTIIAAILLLRTGQNTKIKGDAAVAMLSVGSLAVGYLVLHKFSTSANVSGDVCSTLFGSTAILSLTEKEVWMCVALSVVVIGVYCLFYNRIFAVTFDENFARATGINTGVYNLLLAVITAVVIVMAMSLVGSLLISALIIFPALSAMRILDNFKGVIIYSAVLSVVCAFSGIILSILGSSPVGATIVAVDIAVFFVHYLLGYFLHRT
ncbi:MAG: metal ABC transporter permease [Lachnospiraceae bacterium]|nr:metal ABC transporter permease [Lachnospiraceae bacterium]